MAADDRRRAEIVAGLGTVRARIAAACQAVGRDAHAVTLIAVTKTYPAADVVTLAQLGVLDVGESRDQEARAKLADAEQLSAGRSVMPRWHFVGRVQSRKCRSIAGYATAVHSLDRADLVDRFADGVATARRADALQVFVQLRLDDDTGRGGATAATCLEIADAVAARPELTLRGVMAVPPMGADADVAFARLADFAAELRARHPRADAISAGMSADLEAALRHGSTHVRVGTALLGPRAPFIG